ncbi:hypothetical protein [Sphingomonas sp.]|jgi:hypothetical protein|uniref:hypothetical protein n=1 Tax=Sphingomonas sp. TaxID=28214 RepID=UPI002E30B620|nr:hypothetical protein [Sphingomonas sp.]HEX4695165.1 hypothetical protein [Sphingomonas sp.]
MRLEAPPSRYRVIERDGRLVVIDRQAGEQQLPLSLASSPLVRVEPPISSRPASPSPKSMIADPPGLLRSVAAAVTGEVRDDDGRLLLDTANWFDSKAPRTIALSPAGERRLGAVVLALAAAALVAIALVVTGNVIGWVIAIGGFALVSNGKPLASSWLDGLADA